DALVRGIASHHAGMLPTFKECVEVLFSQGLVKIIFATETLALGINMPARSVVIEKLSKWKG
ncbi:MAG: helicase, partial [Aeromicrobium sp.]|nr:helicase [Aeromicrobium sp.]